MLIIVNLQDTWIDGIALIYPAGKENTYPTKRESWKIIYSNIPEGWGYVSSQEDMDFNHSFFGLQNCLRVVSQRLQTIQAT